MPRFDVPRLAFRDDQGFAAPKRVDVVADHELCRTVEYDDEDVSLVIHVLGRSVPFAPFQDRRVQLLALGTPDGAVSAIGSGGREQLEVAHGTFDQWEEHALLVADVRAEHVGQLRHQRRLGLAGMHLVTEAGDERVDSLMLEESAGERFASLVGLGEQREELLLLLPEMVDCLLPEELQERCGRRAAVLGVRATP